MEVLLKVEMNACAAQSLATSDAALNAEYKKILDCLKPSNGSEKPLIEAQRAWLRFRDAECKFQGAQSEGGTVHPMVVSNCYDALTIQRDNDLEYYLRCQEGDFILSRIRLRLST